MSDSVQEVRDSFGQWMSDNLTGEFACLKWRGTFGGWPEAYGGKDYSLPQMVAFNEEYARYGGPGRSGHIGETLLAPTLIAYGTEAQKQRFLPPILNGTEYWCQGYSEPGAGSDLSNIKTKAWLDGDDWVVEGQKIWTSLAVDADWCFVIARAETGGVDIRPITQITGGSEFNEVHYTQARTAKDNILGKVGDGWRIAMALLGFERGASTLGQQMIFANELDEIIRLAKSNGMARDPLIRHRIAKAYAGLRIMRMTALRSLEGAKAGEMTREAFMSKIYWASWHRDLGDLMRRL